MISSLRFVIDGCLQESDSVRISTPQEAHRYWLTHIASDLTLEVNKEHLVVILLNVKNVVIGHTVVSTGTLSSCLAIPRDIFRSVILGGGKDFILIHNHPSGHVEPSSADKSITKQIGEGADLLELKMQDHLIVSNNSFYSFREYGVI